MQSNMTVSVRKFTTGTAKSLSHKTAQKANKNLTCLMFTTHVHRNANADVFFKSLLQIITKLPLAFFSN